MKKTHIGRGLIIFLLVSIFALGFIPSPSKKVDIAKPAKVQYIDPSNMVPGAYYYYWDHGSGAMVAQFDRYDNGTIYNTYSITPQQSLYTQNGSCTVYDAGNIQLAGLGEILHLLRCILAGLYVL